MDGTTAPEKELGLEIEKAFFGSVPTKDEDLYADWRLDFQTAHKKERTKRDNARADAQLSDRQIHKLEVNDRLSPGDHQAVTPSAVQSAEEITTRTASLSLVLIPGNTQCRDQKFANVRITGPGSQVSTRPGEAIELFDEVHSEPRDIGAGMTIGLKSFDIDIALPERPGVAFMERRASPRGDLSITTLGTDDRPYFRYSVGTPPFKGRFFDRENALGRYIGGMPGDTLEVRMTVSLAVSVVSWEGEELSNRNRQQLKEHFAKQHVLGAPNNNGEITLSKQTLKIETKL